MSNKRSTQDTFDQTDVDLLESVETDFDVNLNALSEELGLSKSAIHYRLEKLKKRGVIRGVTADLDPVPFGLDMVAITEVSVTHEQGYSEDIGNQLAEVDGIEQVYYTMGDVDFVTITRVQDRDQMNTVLDEIVGIDGVKETSSRFVMDEVKSSPSVVTNMSDEMKRIVQEDE